MAVGVQCSTAPNDPLNNLDQYFIFKNWLGNTGCLLKFPFYGKMIGYSRFYYLDNEKIYRMNVVTLRKAFLMERENVVFILKVIKKVKNNIDELI